MEGQSYVQKAYEAIIQHDFEQAIAWFEMALTEQPESAEVHYKLSITCARSGKLNQALKHARFARRLDREAHEYRYHLAHLESLHLIRDAETLLDDRYPDPKEAIAQLKRAIALDPLVPEAFLLMATAYVSLHDVDAAIECVKEVLKLDPNHEAAHALLEKLEH